MTEDLSVDIDEGLVEKYRELIVEGHAEDCLWRKRGCTGTLLGTVFLPTAWMLTM